MKKLLLSLSTLTVIATPIAAVVSCGKDDEQSIYYFASINGSKASVKIVRTGIMPPERLSEANIMSAFNMIQGRDDVSNVETLEIIMQSSIDEAIAKKRVYTVDIQKGQVLNRDIWVKDFRLTKGVEIDRLQKEANEENLQEQIDQIASEYNSTYNRSILATNLTKYHNGDEIDALKLGLPKEFPEVLKNGKFEFFISRQMDATHPDVEIKVVTSNTLDANVSKEKTFILKPSTADVSMKRITDALDSLTLSTTRNEYDLQYISGTGTADVSVTESLLGIVNKELLQINKILLDGMQIEYKVKPNYINGYMEVSYTLSIFGETLKDNKGSFNILPSPATLTYDASFDAGELVDKRSTKTKAELKAAIDNVANLKGAATTKDLGITLSTNIDAGTKVVMSVSDYEGQGDVVVHYELKKFGYHLFGKTKGTFIVKPLDNPSSVTDLASMSSTFADVDSTLTQTELKAAMSGMNKFSQTHVASKLGIVAPAVSNQYTVNYWIGPDAYDFEEKVKVYATVNKKDSSWTITTPAYMPVQNNTFSFFVSPKSKDMASELAKVPTLLSAQTLDKSSPMLDEHVILSKGELFDMSKIKATFSGTPQYLLLTTKKEYYVEVPYDRTTNTLILKVELTNDSAHDDTLFTHNTKLVTLDFN